MPVALSQALRHLPAVLGVLLLIGAVYVVQKEFRSLNLADISKALDAIPRRSLLLSFGATIISYGVLTLYDRLGTLYAGHKVSYRRVALASFCAYALSHNLGFAAVSGAAVRFRLYAHWGLTTLQIGKVVAFCSLTFGLGGMVLGGAILFLEPTAVPFFGTKLPPSAMYAVGAGLWVIVGGYVTLARLLGTVRAFGHTIELPGVRMAVLQVLLATADVAVTAAIFHMLLPPVAGLSFLRFLAVYVASYTAGLAANLPGGIGVFDTAMLLGLSPYLDAPAVVGAIVVFRLYYYIIPLFAAGTLFAGNEIMVRGNALLRPRTKEVRWSEPDFAAATATGVVVLCGFMLLALGVIAPTPDLSWIDPDLNGIAMAAGQFVPSLIGGALLVLALAMSQRVTLAWGSTMLLLPAAAVFTAVQGYHLWIPMILAFACFFVAPWRSAFYRHARLFAGPLQAATVLPLVALVICTIGLAELDRHVQGLPVTSWWAIVLSPAVPLSVRASIGLAVAIGLLAVWRLMRAGRVASASWCRETRQRYAELGGSPPSRADGIVWGETERSGIPFRRVGRVLLGLGDPAGAVSDRVSAVWRLRDLAAQEGLDTAVYGAGQDLLKVYANLGLAALPLGMDGMPLPEMSEQTALAHRGPYLVCQAERDLAPLEDTLRDLASMRRAIA